MLAAVPTLPLISVVGRIAAGLVGIPDVYPLSVTPAHHLCHHAVVRQF